MATTYRGVWIDLVVKHTSTGPAADSESSLRNLQPLAIKGNAITWPKNAFQDFEKLCLRYAAQQASKNHPLSNEISETHVSSPLESTRLGEPTLPSSQKDPEVPTGAPEVNEAIMDAHFS